MTFRIAIVALLFCNAALSQVGIGTTTPDPTSILDISSTSQGLLAPRMTTAQRTAITTPANSLLVYDTDLKSFYYYDTPTTSWIKINASSSQRNNYVLVKSVTDFPAPSGGVITLDENTYYEINGTIILNNPINLNNAYVSGLDANEDILFSAGTVFSGSTGGSIKNITITGGGTAFNITGGASLLVQNTVIAMMGSVGTISNLDLYFGNIIQFVNNDNGITYNNIRDLLLSNQGWFGDNEGTYETFTGTFDLIQKISGFSNVVTGTGMDVTGITTINGDAVLKQVVFYGGGTYVNGNSPYTGFNFTNDWTVDCPGIPREADVQAAGYYYMTGNATETIITTANTPVKIAGTTTAGTNLFRMTNPSSNRLDYKGTQPRNFEVLCTGTINKTSGGNSTYTFYIYKNGVQQNEISQERRFSNADIGNLTLIGLINLEEDDYIEVYAENNTGTGDILVTRLSLTLK